MFNALRIGGMMLALCAATGLAAAQGNQPPNAKQTHPSGTSDRHHTIPPPGAPAQPKNPLGDMSKPAAVGPDQGQTTDQVAETVPGATRQTVPSTISADNAAIDDLPIIAMQLPLTDEQKSKIAASLAKASVAPAGTAAVNVTQSLPTGTTLQEFPAAATEAVPDVSRYKYVNLQDRVLIVDPPFWIVVDEIKK